MKATVLKHPRAITYVDVPDPTLIRSTDAIVRVVAACVCGSDLWRYRGIKEATPNQRIGHEFVGIVESVGVDVQHIKQGQFVIAPFYSCDMTCPNCTFGFSSTCEHLSWWGSENALGDFVDGGQGEYVRVPLADGTLVATPDIPSEDLIPHLLTLSDVFLTGYHAAHSARVSPGATVAVVGDGAVGLSAVLAAKLLGASTIVAMSRHADRQALASKFGATDIVSARGDDGAAQVREIVGATGADCALECVGTKESMAQALAAARPGGRVGYVGVPAGGPELPVETLFQTNKSVAGGVAPVRNYIEALLPRVWNGEITPGDVFTMTMPLNDVAEAYAAMDERRAIKVMLRP